MKMSTLKEIMRPYFKAFKNKKNCKIKDTTKDSSDIYITFNYDKHADVKSKSICSLKSDSMKFDFIVDSEITVNQKTFDQTVVVQDRLNVVRNSVSIDCQTDQDEIDSIDCGFISCDEENIISLNSNSSSTGKKVVNDVKPKQKQESEGETDEDYKIVKPTVDGIKDFLKEKHDENVSCQSDEKTVKSLIPISSEEQNTHEKLNLATGSCFDKSCLELRMSTFEKPITDIRTGLESLDTSDSSYQLHDQDDHEMNCSLLEQKEPFLDLPEILPDSVDDETSYKRLMQDNSDSNPDSSLPELDISSGYPVDPNSTFRKDDDLTMSSHSMDSNGSELMEQSEILDCNDPRLSEMTEIPSAECNKVLSALEPCFAHCMMLEQNGTNEVEPETGVNYNDKENTHSFAGKVPMLEHKLFLMIVMAYYWNRKTVKGRSEELNQSSEYANKILMQTQGNCTLQTSFGIKRLIVFIKMCNDRYTISDTMIVKLVYTYRLAILNSLNLVSLKSSLQIEMFCYMSDGDNCRSKALTGITSKHTQFVDNENIRTMQEAYWLALILTYMKQKLLGRNVCNSLKSMNSSNEKENTYLCEYLEEFGINSKSKIPHSSKKLPNKGMETKYTSMSWLQCTKKIQTTVCCYSELTLRTGKCIDIKEKELEDRCAEITKTDADSVEILKQSTVKDKLLCSVTAEKTLEEVTVICEDIEKGEETCDTSDECVRNIDNLNLGTTRPENARDTTMTENYDNKMSIQYQLQLLRFDQHDIDHIWSFDDKESRKLSNKSDDVVCSNLEEADSDEMISKSENDKNDKHYKGMVVGGTVPSDDKSEGGEKESYDWNLDKNNIKETSKAGGNLWSYQTDCPSKASFDSACLVGCNSIRQNLQDMSVSSSSDEVDIEEKEIDENSLKLESDSTPEWRYTGKLLQRKIAISKDKNSKKESSQDPCHTRRKPKKSRKYFCGYCHKSREEPNKNCTFYWNHKDDKRTNTRATTEIRSFEDKDSKNESSQDLWNTRREPNVSGKKSRKYFCGSCHKSKEEPNKNCTFHENHKNDKRSNTRAMAEIRNSSSLFDSGLASSLVSSVSTFHSSYESTRSQFSSLHLPLTKDIGAVKYLTKNDQLQLLKRFIAIKRLCQDEKDLQLRVKQIVRSLRSLRPADIIAFPGLGGLESYFTRVQNEGELSANERYRHEWVRFQSFDRYRGNGSGIVLARNGFYHDSTNGPTATQCFECGATHSDWQYFDSPQDRHNRNCPHRNGNSPRNIPIHEEDNGARAVSTPGLNLADSTAASSSSTASASRTASRGKSDSAAGATSIVTHAATSTINQNEEKYSYQPTTDADNTEYTSTYVVPSDEDSDQEEATQPTPSPANRAGLSLSSSTITSGGSGRNNSPLTASKQRHHGDMGGDSSINTASAATQGSDLGLPTTPQASPLFPPSGQLSAPSDPAAPSLLATSGQPIEASRPVQIELSEEAVSRLPLETLGQVQTHPELIVVDTPKHPDHLTVESRAATFKPPWPNHLDQTPRRMAEAGLFYSGVADFTRCYACGGGLRNWESGDDPVIEHTRWYPECQYVKKLKGEKYVKAVTAKQQKHLEERRQQQQQQIARREQQRQRQPPDALRTQAASILTEMGYPQETIRDAIEDVRRHTGRMEVSAEQALLWIIDDEERRARIAEQRAAGPAAFHSHVPARSPVTISSSSSSSSSGSSRSLLSASPSQTESSNTSRNTPGTSTAKSSSGGSREPSSTATSSSVTAGSQPGATGGPESDDENSSKGNDTQPTKGKSAKRRKKKKKAGERPATAVSGARPGPSDFDTESLKQENEKLREIQTCKICLDKAVDTTFLPCGHLVCCSGCAGKMRKCPICRELVRGLVRTYMS